MQMLPRKPSDLESAFIVLTGSLKVLYGKLGEHVLAIAQEKTAAKRAPAPEAGSISPLVHRDAAESTGEQLVEVCT